MDQSGPFAQFNGSEVAVIGLAGRFPGSRTLEEFWHNLYAGVESITFLKEDEIEPWDVDPSAFHDPNYVRAASLLDGVDLFDANFFGYSPREAEVMDPQHRLFLECAWEALETAGYDPKRFQGAVGVYAGARTNTYLFNLFSNRDLARSLGAFQVGLGNDLGFLATRVSYKLNLCGPSYSVQTACSTGLVAVHLACQSLLTGECEIALAGSVAINVPQKTGYLYQPGGILSPDGHCRAFDARAQGTLFGSGVGVVVLKRMEDALADGDTIEAVIKGSATNNDGSVKASFTAPGVHSQAEVILEALASAGVSADTLSYIEAHGTGTPLGDPIEIRALTRAFRVDTDENGFCAIGSAKTNFGHLDAAAGMAGLIKTILALKHRQLPPSLHFEHANPGIDFAATPFYVNTEACAWETERLPRRAGVSAFGIGGTNAHLVLEEAPPRAPSGDSRPDQLLVLSAKTRSALDAATRALADYLKQRPELELADVAYTLHVGRESFNHRRVVVCQNREAAVKALEMGGDPRLSTSFQETGGRPVVFMFPGQGAQYAAMASDLYQFEPTFREHLDRCAERLKQHQGLDLRGVLYPGPAQAEAMPSTLNQTAFTQPALFAVEYALAMLWMEWGIRPQALIGHSLGEYVAACLAGVFSWEYALDLVAARGRLMQAMPGGAMLAVPLAEAELRPWLDSRLSVAALNEPSQCVVSGPAEAIEEMERKLAGHAIAGCRRLQTSHAFHSAMMDPVVSMFAEQVDSVPRGRPEIPFISNVTGSWITDGQARDSAYWTSHLRQPVRFAEGIQSILNKHDCVLLEVGPGHTLSRLARRCGADDSQCLVLASLPPAERRQTDHQSMLGALGQLWLSGAVVGWSGFYAHERRQRLPLPAYPFERQRYWLEPGAPATGAVVSRASVGKKADVGDWFYGVSWKRSQPPASLSKNDWPQAPYCWLIFEDACGLGPAIVNRLQQAGQEAVRVTAGERFSQLEDGRYTVNPQAPESYQALFEALRQANKVPRRIVHLWSLTPNPPQASETQLFRDMQGCGYFSLLFMVQGLSTVFPNAPLYIEVVSNYLHAVNAQEPILPEKAPLMGLCKVVPQEFAHLHCRCIDAALPEPGTRQAIEFVERLLAEFVADSSDMAIAYRGHERWIQDFEASRLSQETEPRRPLREKGVYLIVGGLGGVGLIIAECLARAVQAKLILTGRSIFPERDSWHEWLAQHGTENETSQKIHKLQALEALGSDLMTLSADAANEEQMREVIEAIDRRFGALHGVIYTAGITSGPSVFRALAEIGRAESEAQFQPKVYGVYVLEKVLQGRPVDFCLLFSSLASVLGGLGFGAYAAANLFMDAFVDSRRQTSPVPWISADWDHWPQETWQYTGIQTSIDQYTMTRPESEIALQRVLTLAPEGQVVVATGDLPARLDRWIRRDFLKDASPSTGESVAPSTRRRASLDGDYVAPRNDVERVIAELWQQALGIEAVGIHDNFFNLGGHSLLATQVLFKMRQALQVDLPLHRFFESPTVAGVAEVIDADGQHDREALTKIGQTLERLQQLSAEEVEAALAQNKKGTGHRAE